MASLFARARFALRVVGAFVPAIALAGVFAIRAAWGMTPPDPRVGASLSATSRLALAADQIEASLSTGNKGFTFTVVQRSTLNAKPGGPKVEIPDPNDRYKSLGFADQYYTGGAIADGSVTPDGFWLEMRFGPSSDGAAPDFARAPVTLSALQKGKQIWRNDGEGWYPTDDPPGIGLDPATVRLLPDLLRSATQAAVTDTAVVDGATETTLEALGLVSKAPGIMAVDAASFTELVGPMEFTVDTYGRLIGIHAITRNVGMTTYDLLVDVVIEIRYDTKPGLPDPDPTLTPAVKA